MLVNLLIVLICIKSILANECTTACDAAYEASSSMKITFCGTDRLTYHTNVDAVNEDYCYAQCGVMSQFQGACGCPNNCLSQFGHGVCAEDKMLCECNAGWTGNDCSLPTIGNACGNHGKLIIGASDGSKFPFDYCECDAGWTGTDCSSEELDVDFAPWGDIIEDAPQYTDADKYGDDHPIWQISKLATIRVRLDERDYINLLLPQNLYNESYAKADIYFDNGKLQESIYNAGIRIKGAYSRMDQKKGWAIKFNEFVSGQKLADKKKIAMKAGSVDDDTLLKTKLFADFYRAMGVPTQRASYALLYINDVYTGVYYLHEDIDTDFLRSRIPNDGGEGNLMKYFWNVHLGYYGSDVSYYQSKAHINELGVSMYYYEQSEGDGDWTDFIDWLYYFNTTCNNSELFTTSVEGRVEVGTLLRGMPVEAFLLGSDNMASGANYFTYHRDYQKDTDQYDRQWVFFDADFDECFASNGAGVFEEETDILEFYLTTDINEKYDDINPLVNALLLDSNYRKQYLLNFRAFLTSTFGSSSPQQPTSRYAEMLQFLYPWVQRDQLWQMSFGITAEEFMLDAQRTIELLPKRYTDVMTQIDKYLTQN